VLLTCRAVDMPCCWHAVLLTCTIPSCAAPLRCWRMPFLEVPQLSGRCAAGARLLSHHAVSVSQHSLACWVVCRRGASAAHTCLGRLPSAPSLTDCAGGACLCPKPWRTASSCPSSEAARVMNGCTWRAVPARPRGRGREREPPSLCTSAQQTGVRLEPRHENQCVATLLALPMYSSMLASKTGGWHVPGLEGCFCLRVHVSLDRNRQHRWAHGHHTSWVGWACVRLERCDLSACAFDREVGLGSTLALCAASS